jgi:ribosome-associated toxin RatA of RatAB toxin-antitoxin module
MPHIDNQVLINAPLDRVYALARDVETFPEFMPDVESVNVAEKEADGSRTVTEWVGVAREFKLKIRWTEEDLWDDATYTCTFHQIRGDYKAYSGSWTFTEQDGQTLFASSIDYEIEIPMIGALLKAVIGRLMRDNTQKVLEAIKTRAEQAAG